jgi:glycosyltransferase involved in cell wall biosynthesis
VIITWFVAKNKAHRELLSELATSVAPVRVFAVCELGPDQPPNSMDSLSRQHANLTVLEMDAIFGRGAALRAGLAQTREELVAFVDLDGRVDPEAIVSAFERLVAARVDGIVFDRFAPGVARHLSPLDTFKTRAIDAAVRAGFGLTVRDVRSPLKVFLRGPLLAIFEKLRLYAHGFDIDLLLNAKRLGCRILESPLPPGRFALGRKTVSDVASTIAPLLALRLYHSPLGRLPFADLVAAHYALPAKRQYSIAILCWRDPLSPKAGGGEVYLHEQAKFWVRQGCEVTWVAERYAGSSREEVLDGIRIVRRGRGLFVFAAVPIWYLLESSRRYDFIIDVMNGIPFFSPLYSMKPKVCLIYHVHAQHFRDELPRAVANIAVWMESKLVPLVYRFTRFVTISESTRQELRRLAISNLPIAMIHSGVPSNHVPGRKAAQPTVLYLGRVRQYKQIRKLLDAFAVVKATVADARLIVVGTGDDLADLVAETRARGIPDVVFLGRVDEATKIRLMQEAWVFGMPSRVEGWGIVVIEAAACGTPAVAYDVNGLRDCILDRTTGFLSRDDAAFAENLLTILSDEDLRGRMSSAAVAWASQFSWERTAARTLETIRLAQPWRAVFEPLDEMSWGIRERNRDTAVSLGAVRASSAAHDARFTGGRTG